MIMFGIQKIESDIREGLLSRSKILLLVSVVLIILAALAFFPSLSNDFQRQWDDQCQLEIYNFATGLYTDSIPIPREGPNSPTNISSVYYHNRDSIFVLDVVEHRILIYNTNGKVSKIVNIDNEADQSHPLWGLHAYNNLLVGLHSTTGRLLLWEITWEPQSSCFGKIIL